MIPLASTSSMKVMPNDENDFLSTLPRDLRDSYKKRRKEFLQNIDSQFSDESALTKKKSRGILEDRYHKEVLNACIFPFVQEGTLTQNLDYDYLRSSPLSELGVKNVDFLIASKSKGLAIFGEAKGTVTDPSIIISEYKKRIKIIEKNLDHVKKIFPELSSIEYVLGVKSIDAVEMSKAILRSNADIVLWQVGGWDDQLLSLVVPATDDSSQRKRIIHSDNDLNKSLTKVPTSTEFKTFFHESHPVTKMALLATVDKGKREQFSFNDFKLLVSEELDNTSESEIDEITKEIIDNGINIGFVRETEDGDYKIQSRFKNSGDRYEELKKKWISYKIKMDKENAIQKSLSELQKEFLQKKPSLDKFNQFFL